MIKKCEYCNKRYRFETLHNRGCWKRRAILKRGIEVIQEIPSDVVPVEIEVVENKPIEIETEKPKRKYTKKEKP